MILCLIGFVFFTTSLTLVLCYSSEVKGLLKEKYKIGAVDNSTSTESPNEPILSYEEKLEKAKSDADRHIKLFYMICIGFSLAYVAVFIQLFITKAKSKKVVIPLILVTSVTFLVLIAIDFYLEIQLTHSTFRDNYMQSKDAPGKKGKAKFKTGYLIIYGEILVQNLLEFSLNSFQFSACFVITFGYIFFAYKELEEYLERLLQTSSTPSTPKVIVISHIT